MKKLYVFAIGGSGARVVRSLVMLLSAGVELKNYDVVVPILMDPDLSNGDLTRTSNLLADYQRIHSMASKSGGFFGTQISTLSQLKERNPDKVSSSDHFKFDLSKISGVHFNEFIGYNEMLALENREARDLVDLLYDQEEIKSSMSVGFKGKPNIGSVVLDSFFQHRDYKEFCNTFNEGDAIFIVSSIFGGTGAAGFPLMLRNLRTESTEVPRSNVISKAPIGAVSLQPYFKLKDSDIPGNIDSKSFYGKTKAALKYYKNTVFNGNLLNYFYYLGYASNNGYENHSGAEQQENDAHIVELASALGVFDFAMSLGDDFSLSQDRVTKYREYGFQNDLKESHIIFEDFSKQSLNQIRIPLSKLRLAQLFFRTYQTETSDSEVWRERVSNEVLSGENTRLLHKYFDHFDSWLAELSKNTPGVKPYKPEIAYDSLLNFIEGSEVKSGKLEFWKNPAHGKKLNESLNIHSDDLKYKVSGFSLLLHTLDQSTEDIITKLNF